MSELTPHAFTELALQRMAAHFEGWRLSTPEPLVIEAEVPDGGTHRISLLHPWRNVVAHSGPRDLTGELDRFLASVAERAEGPGALVVMVKPRSWIEQARAQGAELPFFPLAGQLVGLFGRDTPRNVSFATDVEADNERLREAIANVARLVDGPQIHGAGPWMLTAGGTYEASLLFFGFWSQLRADLGIVGELLVAVPCRDLLYVLDSGDPEHMAKLPQMVREPFERGFSYLMTQDVLRWTGEDWALWTRPLDGE